MNSRRLLQQAIELTLVALLLVGCGGTPAGPAATPTLVPPTPTPSSVIVTPIAYAGICITVLPGKTMEYRLTDIEGTLINTAIEIQGEICGDSTGITLDRDDNVLRILSEANGTWYKIKHTEIVDGLLIITAENGLYPFITEGQTLTPIAREVKPAVITSGDYWWKGGATWQGEASFIITGLNTNYAIVFQDTRNYDIQR